MFMSLEFSLSCLLRGAEAGDSAVAYWLQPEASGGRNVLEIDLSVE